MYLLPFHKIAASYNEEMNDSDTMIVFLSIYKYESSKKNINGFFLHVRGHRHYYLPE
jgi:hypothetical protein